VCEAWGDRHLHSSAQEVPPALARQLNGSPDVSRPAPARAPAPQPAPPPAGGSDRARQIGYDSCMRHCAVQSLQCSMGTGNYIGGKNRYTGVPCSPSQSGCELNCKLAR
jgi:hypothetical protein